MNRIINTQSTFLLAVLLLAFVAFPSLAAGQQGGAEVVTDGFTVVKSGSYQAPAAAKPARRWDVPANVPFRIVLEGWAKNEGWHLYWPASADGSELVAAVDVGFYAADFEEAVTKFFGGLPAELGLATTFNRANSPRLLYVDEAMRKPEIR